VGLPCSLEVSIPLQGCLRAAACVGRSAISYSGYVIAAASDGGAELDKLKALAEALDVIVNTYETPILRWAVNECGLRGV
jgi:hypothetical protein